MMHSVIIVTKVAKKATISHQYVDAILFVFEINAVAQTTIKLSGTIIHAI